MSYIRAWKACKTLVVILHSFIIEVIFSCSISVYVELLQTVLSCVSLCPCAVLSCVTLCCVTPRRPLRLTFAPFFEDEELENYHGRCLKSMWENIRNLRHTENCRGMRWWAQRRSHHGTLPHTRRLRAWNGNIVSRHSNGLRGNQHRYPRGSACPLGGRRFAAYKKSRYDRIVAPIQDVFVWSHEKMKGLDPKFYQH